ncbi:MAG: glucose-1-phosphate adenylyltransferase [Planctomycetota bacterium]|nr:glucose-1-phosphate adenylyltransferase [Planctomycetota bacterium]
MNRAHQLKSTLTFILAGGRGQRLSPLTIGRAKPAVPFGGAYRIIDFTLSNTIHSGLRRTFVLTQYQAYSLEEHLRYAWNFLPRRLSQFIAPRPPQHGGSGAWYRGTADAISQNLALIEQNHCDHVLILSGDHIYKMDYGDMLEQHVESGAACTIAAVEIDAAEAPRFGILEVDTESTVTGFQEKPPTGTEIPGKPGRCLGSMGIYIFEKRELMRRLEEDAAKTTGTNHDFGQDILPLMVAEGSKVVAHSFQDVDRSHRDDGAPYWRDVGTLDAYYNANLDLCSALPQFNLYDGNWPIYTLRHNDPPAKTVLSGDDGPSSQVVDSMLCNGSIVSGSRVQRSILSNRVHTGADAEIMDSIIMSGVKIGEGAVIRRAIIDKWTVVPPGAQIGVNLDEDRQRFTVSESGIVCVPTGFEFDPRRRVGDQQAPSDSDFAGV